MNDNQNMNLNDMNNQNGSNPIPTGPAPSQNDYYNNENYYANNNYSNANNANYNDTSYEEPKENNGLWWKILLGVLLLLIIIIIILKSVGGSKTSEAKYTELKNSLCKAAETYVGQNTGLIDTSSPGASVSLKLRKLSDASLISARLENPDYDGSLFKKSSVDKYYSLDNSVRLTVLTNGEYSCELVNNSNDITAPELRLLGDAEIELAVGTEFEDPGYTATDDFDGDIKANVTRSGNVDTTKAGEYTITYTVTDTAGNVTSKTRKVVVSEYANIEITLGSILDKVTPMISLKGSNPYCLVKGQTFVEPGAVATDNVDGTITNKIAITNKVTGNLMGAFRVVYKVEDSSGNQAIAYRAIIVTTECPEQKDEELIANNAPVITLVGKSAVTIQKGTQYLDLGATAYDKEDGDLTNSIITDTTGVNANSAGVYKVYYRVTDSNGKLTTAVRTVTVKESVSGNPSVRFTTTKSNINVFLGEGKDSLIEAPKAVNENGVTVSVSTKIEDYATKVDTSSINWNLVGKYRVTYTAVHGNGTVKQTKSIVVTITSQGVSIGGPNEITMTKRNSNCDITEADLRAGGVTFTSGNSSAPIVTLEAPDRSACAVGTYDVKVFARDTDNDSTFKTVKVKVTDGSGTIDVTAPSKVIVTYNSASTDPYNYAGKWVGGAATGIVTNFTATPKTGTSIAYYEYSDDCNAVDGKANSTGATTGTLNWIYEGKSSVCIRAVTSANARGPWSDPVKLYLDKTGPEVSFTHTWADDVNDWHNSYSLLVSYDATDKSGSGLDHFEYTYDDVRGKYGDKVTNPTTVEEGSGKLTVYEDTESARSKLFVYVRAVDKAGNFGEWTLNPAFANIDTVKPNTPTLEVTGDGTSVVKLTATVTDGTSVRPSGFGKLIYTVNSGAELTENTKIITAPSNKTTENVINLIKVWAMDKAGNKSDGNAEKSVTVAPAKISATAVALKNGDTTIADGSSCSPSAIKVGDTFTLTATPVPADADDKEVKWASSSGTVAVIADNGTVTVNSAGKATITVKIGEVSTMCVIEATAADNGGGSGGGGTTPTPTKPVCTNGNLRTSADCAATATAACQSEGGRTTSSCQTANSLTGCYTYSCNGVPGVKTCTNSNLATTGSCNSYATSVCAMKDGKTSSSCQSKGSDGCYTYSCNSSTAKLCYNRVEYYCTGWDTKNTTCASWSGYSQISSNITACSTATSDSGKRYKCEVRSSAPGTKTTYNKFYSYCTSWNTEKVSCARWSNGTQTATKTTSCSSSTTLDRKVSCVSTTCP